MLDAGISTFDLGKLDAGTDIEVILMSPAKIRLLPSQSVAALSDNQSPQSAFPAKPLRRFRVPRAGHWRILVEHADAKRKGGCSIRLSSPA
jgi:hypothetical protein